MSNDNVIELQQPTQIHDPLTELIRSCSRELIAKAVNAELEELLAQFSGEKVDGMQRVVRNGYLPR